MHPDNISVSSSTSYFGSMYIRTRSSVRRTQSKHDGIYQMYDFLTLIICFAIFCLFTILILFFFLFLRLLRLSSSYKQADTAQIQQANRLFQTFAESCSMFVFSLFVTKLLQQSSDRESFTFSRVFYTCQKYIFKLNMVNFNM